ncbi:MAG: hypothetical protein C6W56_11280 [Caldibacillus debilis]|nr:MAG: hypothetical protein C6W56_11280 [Caldibacillus debilis]
MESGSFFFKHIKTELKTGRSLRSRLKWAGGSAPCLLFKADRFSFFEEMSLGDILFHEKS